MKARQKRFVFVAMAIIGVAIAGALVVQALRSNTNYFFTPAQVLAGEAPRDAPFRIGGLVEKGSLKRSDKDLTVSFVVVLNEARVPVRYTGILPDLFGEGQGVVTRGRMGDGGIFQAEEVLAKHDEDYMPPEVADAMKKPGSKHPAGIERGQVQ
jgi:cytochrome c-type biogenesis protein CcmE